MRPRHILFFLRGYWPSNYFSRLFSQASKRGLTDTITASPSLVYNDVNFLKFAANFWTHGLRGKKGNWLFELWCVFGVGGTRNWYVRYMALATPLIFVYVWLPNELGLIIVNIWNKFYYIKQVNYVYHRLGKHHYSNDRHLCKLN